MAQLLSKTLSQIINERHQAAAVFEKYDLNYCCSKGKRSLHEACDENNVPVNVVAEALENIYSAKPNEPDFNGIKLCELADYIVHTHHSYVKNEIPLILSRLEKVTHDHSSRHSELNNISALFAELSNQMSHHMHSEETVLFPWIRQLEQNTFELIPVDYQTPGYPQSQVINMEHPNNRVAEIMAEIRKLTNNYTATESSCTTFKLLYASLQAFETDLHQHLYLENKILFPKALVLEKN